ncbi:MAG: hypothetical protein ACE5NC_02520 [Anaerolineae bacterium]
MRSKRRRAESRRLALLTLVLSVLVLGGLLASYLALTDIYRGVEPDLEAEWWVVRLSFILTGLLILSAGLLVRGVLRELDSHTAS